MKPSRFLSAALQSARLHATEQLRAQGLPLKTSIPVADLVQLIADRTAWAMPAPESAAHLSFLQRFLDSCQASVTPPPYRPVVRRPMRYDLAMRTAAARAAKVQPHVTPASSNVITWRELAS